MSDIICANCSRSEVIAKLAQAAIAGPGTRVILPNNQSSPTTWASSVGSVPAGVTLRGDGMGNTIIMTTAGQNGLGLSSDAILEHISFVQADGTTSDNQIVSTGASQNFVIRHCSFSNICGRGIVCGTSGTAAHPTGCIHDCAITAKNYVDPADGTFQLITVQGGENNFPPEENPNTGSLRFDPGFGSSNAVFIERNDINQNAQGDSTIETYIGGKVVVRYNTITNFMLGVHGTDSSVRSGHIFEIYENEITNTIGGSHQGTVHCRGGSGVVFNNTIIGDHSKANKIVIQSYRSAGQLAFDDPNYLTRFPYAGRQADGHYFDGNTAVSNGTGTHDGSNGAAVLSDSTKSWGVNELAGTGDYTLTNNLQSYFLWNTTKSVGGRIVANTATTATVDRMVYCQTTIGPSNPTTGTVLSIPQGKSGLFPATPFNIRLWNTGRDSSVPGEYEIATCTSKASESLTVVRAQSGTTAISVSITNISVEGGARNTWDSGDAYNITLGYPGLDQPGWTGPTTFSQTGVTQQLNPLYAWGNTFNGAGGTAALPFAVDFLDSGHTTIAQPDTSFFVQENREFYNNTPRPDYTPYTYPHPLRKIPLTVFSSQGGTYNNDLSVTLSSDIDDAEIRYTTNGDDPTPESGTIYEGGPIVVTNGMTIKAIAYDGFLPDSDIAEATYVLKVAAPTLDPLSGGFSDPIDVSAASATTGVTFYYTTNGQEPDDQDTEYSAPIGIASTTILKVIGYRDGYDPSDVSFGIYVISGTPGMFVAGTCSLGNVSIG